jgi:hypothetical protein
MPIFPINFSIHSSKIVESFPKKTRILAPLIPGDLTTYLYDTEEEYCKMYQESCFAVTTKKAGWDCIRHYEILANGCIPLFFGLDECPMDTMTTFPRNLIQEIHEFYFSVIDTPDKKCIGDLTHQEMTRIESYIYQLLDYTRTHLTNRHVAEHVIKMVGQQTIPRRILFLSGCLAPDYLRCTLLVGLKELYGSACHDYPKVPHLYTSYTGNANDLYGRGFTYTKILDETILRDASLDHNIERDIETQQYDLIIYGSAHRGLPYWDLVNRYYTKNRIVLVCGEDHPHCDVTEWLGKEHPLFIRELDKTLYITS